MPVARQQPSRAARNKSSEYCADGMDDGEDQDDDDGAWQQDEGEKETHLTDSEPSSEE